MTDFTENDVPAQDDFTAGDTEQQPYTPKPLGPSATWGIDRSGSGNSTKDFLKNTSLGRVMDQMGVGGAEGFGPEPLGLTEESKYALSTGDFNKEYGKHQVTFAGAMSETVLQPAAVAWDIFTRGFPAALQAVGKGAGQAYREWAPGWLDSLSGYSHNTAANQFGDAVCMIGDSAALATMAEPVYMGLEAPKPEQLGPRAAATSDMLMESGAKQAKVEAEAAVTAPSVAGPETPAGVVAEQAPEAPSEAPGSNEGPSENAGASHLLNSSTEDLQNVAKQVRDQQDNGYTQIFGNAGDAQNYENWNRVRLNSPDERMAAVFQKKVDDLVAALPEDKQKQLDDLDKALDLGDAPAYEKLASVSARYDGLSEAPPEQVIKFAAEDILKTNPVSVTRVLEGRGDIHDQINVLPFLRVYDDFRKRGIDTKEIRDRLVGEMRPSWGDDTAEIVDRTLEALTGGREAKGAAAEAPLGLPAPDASNPVSVSQDSRGWVVAWKDPKYGSDITARSDAEGTKFASEADARDFAARKSQKLFGVAYAEEGAKPVSMAPEANLEIAPAERPSSEAPAKAPVEEGQPKAHKEVKATDINSIDDLRNALVNEDYNPAYAAYPLAGDVTHMPQIEHLADSLGLEMETLLQTNNKWFNLDPARSARFQKLAVDLANDLFEKSKNITTEADAKAYIEAKQRLSMIQDEVDQIKYLKGLTLKAQQLLPVSKEEQLAAEAMSEFAKDNKITTPTKVAVDEKGKAVDTGEMTPEMLQAIKDEAQEVRKLNSPESVAKYTRGKKRTQADGLYEKGRNAVLEYLYNAMLTSPKTHAANIVGNTIAQLLRATDTAVAGVVGGARSLLTGSPDRVYMGESVQKLFGMLQGAPEGWKAAVRAMKEEEPTFGASTKTDKMPHAIPGKVGRVIRAPGTALMAADEFFKAMAYRSNLNALAYREAMQKKLSWSEAAAHIAKRRDNPTKEMREAAVAEANYDTFTGELGKGGKFLELAARQFPVAKFLFVPFYKFMTNNFKFLIDHSPLGPVQGIWSKEAAATLKGENGGAARDDMFGKMIVGTGLLTLATKWAMNGTITGNGPKDPVERKIWLLNNKPNSVVVGDQSYQYNRILGPIAPFFSTAADVVSIVHKLHTDDQAKLGTLLLIAAGNLGRNLPLANALADMSDIVDANNSAHFERWAWNIGTRAIPAVSYDISKLNDPYVRDVQSFLDAVKVKIGMGSDLKPMLDVFGQPIKQEGALGPDLISPVSMQTTSGDPVLKAMEDVGYTLAKPNDVLNGVKLNSDQYYDYQVTAGTLTKLRLARLISLPGWNSIPTGRRKQIMSDEVAKVRESSRKAIMAKYGDLWTSMIKNKMDIWKPIGSGN